MTSGKIKELHSLQHFWAACFAVLPSTVSEFSCWQWQALAKLRLVIPCTLLPAVLCQCGQQALGGCAGLHEAGDLRSTCALRVSPSGSKRQHGLRAVKPVTWLGAVWNGACRSGGCASGHAGLSPAEAGKAGPCFAPSGTKPVDD